MMMTVAMIMRDRYGYAHADAFYDDVMTIIMMMMMTNYRCT